MTTPITIVDSSGNLAFVAGRIDTVLHDLISDLPVWSQSSEAMRHIVSDLQAVRDVLADAGLTHQDGHRFAQGDVVQIQETGSLATILGRADADDAQSDIEGGYGPLYEVRRGRRDLTVPESMLAWMRSAARDPRVRALRVALMSGGAQ